GPPRTGEAPGAAGGGTTARRPKQSPSSRPTREVEPIDSRGARRDSGPAGNRAHSLRRGAAARGGTAGAGGNEGPGNGPEASPGILAQIEAGETASPAAAQ